MYKRGKSELQLVRLTNSYLHAALLWNHIHLESSTGLKTWISDMQEISRIGQNFLNILFIHMKCCSILYQSYVRNMKKFMFWKTAQIAHWTKNEISYMLFSKTWHFLTFPTHNQQRIGQHFMQMNEMCRKLALYPTDFLHARNSNFYLM